MKPLLRSLLFVACCTAASYAVEPQVIAIGIGDKNPTLNESKFPHIRVYYTPDLSVSTTLGEQTLSGEPQPLVQWFNGVGEPGDFLVIGSNGVVYDQGKLITTGSSMLDVETDRKGTLAKSAWAVVQKDRTVSESSSPVDGKKEDGFVRRKFPECTLLASDGSRVNASSVIGTGQPQLLVFFYLDPVTYIGGAQEGTNSARGKEYMKQQMESSSATVSVDPLIQIERELFGNPVETIY